MAIDSSQIVGLNGQRFGSATPTLNQFLRSDAGGIWQPVTLDLGSLGIFRQSFTDASLTAGVLTVTHGLGTLVVSVQVYDELNKIVRPDVTLVSASALTLDFAGFGTIPSTFNVIVVGGANASQLKRESLLVTASRNLAATDNLKQLYSTSASNFTLIIQAATFALDDEVEVAADSTGTVTIAAGAGVTINGASTSVVVAAGKGSYLKFRSASSARFYGGA